MSQTITAMFDSRTEASRAVERLVSEGISRASIRILPEHESMTTGTSTGSSRSSYDYNTDEKGLWASLKDMFMPDEDRATYAEGMHRGGTTVIATVEVMQVERAADILEEHGSVDVDEREQSWRQEGWAGYRPSSDIAGGSAAVRGSDRNMSERGTSEQGETERIPVVEEQLRVGKRQTVGGHVKVRSYVVETPVNEEVTLRDESVSVERRPVDRPLTATESPGMFKDHTVEVEERDEEAVVSKEARVKEEVVVGKTATERRQNVSDTVRRTEVDVEDDRTDRSMTTDRGATGSDPTLTRRRP